jgi:hypothetical protein
LNQVRKLLLDQVIVFTTVLHESTSNLQYIVGLFPAIVHDIGLPHVIGSREMLGALVVVTAVS